MNYFEENTANSGFKTFDDIKLWEKCYWYLRFFIDTNRFGALAKDKKRINSITENLSSTYRLVQRGYYTEKEKVNILQKVLTETLFEGIKKGTRKEVSVSNLSLQLEQLLLTAHDFLILTLTLKELLIPTNDAIEKVPTDESTNFARKFGKAVLDEKKEEGLASLIKDWDSFTEAISLNKERDLIVTLVRQVRKNINSELSKYQRGLEQEDLDIVISAICQEYERRTGQKRKQRAGNDLESVTEFVFNYFGIKTAGKPEHFTTGLEVDNWIKDKNGWYIGVSLKRTLRERWKQTYTTEIGLLDRYKIKYIIHIINNDFDLSDSKITELGAYRHLFFLADDSSVLKKLQGHVAMEKYVFPMSELIVKIREFIG